MSGDDQVWWSLCTVVLGDSGRIGDGPIALVKIGIPASFSLYVRLVIFSDFLSFLKMLKYYKLSVDCHLCVKNN